MSKKNMLRAFSHRTGEGVIVYDRRSSREAHFIFKEIEKNRANGEYSARATLFVGDESRDIKLRSFELTEIIPGFRIGIWRRQNRGQGSLRVAYSVDSKKYFLRRERGFPDCLIA